MEAVVTITIKDTQNLTDSGHVLMINEAKALKLFMTIAEVWMSSDLSYIEAVRQASTMDDWTEL